MSLSGNSTRGICRETPTPQTPLFFVRRDAAQHTRTRAFAQPASMLAACAWGQGGVPVLSVRWRLASLAARAPRARRSVSECEGAVAAGCTCAPGADFALFERNVLNRKFIGSRSGTRAAARLRGMRAKHMAAVRYAQRRCGAARHGAATRAEFLTHPELHQFQNHAFVSVRKPCAGCSFVNIC